jgi:hypothetical protein
MPTQQPRSCQRIVGALVCLTAIWWAGGTALTAQEPESPSSFAGSVAKQVALDPSTYAPAVIAYDAAIRDWKTSQPLFQSGFIERNSHYTRSGLPNDAPLTYGDGNRRIFFDSLAILGASAAHNALERTVERGLVTRYPEHRRLIGALGWVERISFGVGMAYVLSNEHYRQAEVNAAQARALGLR